jgi:hypothetical protein
MIDAQSLRKKGEPNRNLSESKSREIVLTQRRAGLFSLLIF